jgi:hypothetical protein
LNTKKLFVGIHQDCDVILSLARLLNFSPSRVDCGKDGKKEGKKVRGGKKVISIYSLELARAQK